MLWVQGHEAVLLLLMWALLLWALVEMVPHTLILIVVMVSLWMVVVALTRISQIGLSLVEVHQ